MTTRGEKNIKKGAFENVATIKNEAIESERVALRSLMKVVKRENQKKISDQTEKQQTLTLLRRGVN